MYIQLNSKFDSLKGFEPITLYLIRATLNEYTRTKYNVYILNNLRLGNPMKKEGLRLSHMRENYMLLPVSQQ